MSAVYHIHLADLDSPSGTISVRALAELLEVLVDAGSKTLRLAVEGISGRPGPSPEWLRRSTDLTFTGLEPGSTVLAFEAPTLQETAPEIVLQRELWDNQPHPMDTAVTLITLTLRDIKDGVEESERYDRAVLRSLIRLGKALPGAARITFYRDQRTEETITICRQDLEAAASLRARIPHERTVVVTGKLDNIGYSTGRFQLLLKDKTMLRGVIQPDVIALDLLRQLWGQEITIRGEAFFTPHGTVRMIAADLLRPVDIGDELFERAPRVEPSPQRARDLRRYNAGSALKELWGQWPGDEPIDDLLNALSEDGK